MVLVGMLQASSFLSVLEKLALGFVLIKKKKKKRQLLAKFVKEINAPSYQAQKQCFLPMKPHSCSLLEHRR